MYAEYADRLILVYSAQIILVLVVSLLFFYFHKNYQRLLLKWWSFSWLCYAGAHIASAALLYVEIRAPWSFLILFFSYLQLLFLIAGVLEFLKKKNVRQFLRAGFIVISIISLVSYALYSNSTDGANERYILRVGMKALLIGVGFAWISLRILFAKAFLRRFSKYFLVSAFILYAVQQLWFACIVFLNVAGFEIQFPINSYGIIDLFTISIMAIGMIVWLLENERFSLRRANTELDSFLYSTSHDLRAPLASILGLTNLGRLESKDATAIQYFDKIESRINALDLIVGDILNYSKSIKMPISKEKIIFRELVTDIFDQLKFAKGQNDIKLKIIESEKAHFYSDPNQLRIILNNLLSNAVKYCDARKKNKFIEVELKRHDHMLRLLVRDNGIGIDEENLDKIFNMFYRATNVSEGSGLGLYIAREATKKLKGQMIVESKLGEGSTFTVVINENWI